MKVFALLCAAAIAVSSPAVDAACTSNVCTSDTGIPAGDSGTDVTLDPACASGKYAYVTAISWTGDTVNDKVTFSAKNADGAVAGTACATESGTLSTGETPVTKTSQECGKAEGKNTMVTFVCKKAASADCAGDYSVTFACADNLVADDPTALKCTDANVCSSAGGTISKTTAKSVAIGTACTGTKKSYVTGISYAGKTTADKLTYTVKSGTTAATGTNCATAEASATAGVQTLAALSDLECGKGGADDATVELTCKNAAADCTADYSVTFACAEPTNADDPTAVKCTDANVCSSTGGKISKSTPTSVAIGTACTAPKMAYVKGLSYTGKTTTDKLTYTVKSDGTAVTGTSCATAATDATAGVQTLAAVSDLTCGKGGAKDATVELTCKNADADCTADYSVTFDCADPTATTPAPSTGSMLTTANAIVGVISGMVGAIVYFNRG